MSDIAPRHSCCGCAACLDACPAACISIKTDAQGFGYPDIDSAACTDCGRCRAVCPARGSAHADSQKHAYAVLSLDRDTVRASSSGGVFSMLAAPVLSNGGVVFGAAWDDELTVRHVCARTPDELPPLRLSKYVQSDMRGVYRPLRAALEAGQSVLFCGTPCQVAGVARAFPDREGLLLAEVACHGVPSPGVWRAYLDALERAWGAKARAVNMRDRTNGWVTPSIAVEFENGRKMIELFTDNAYIKGFLGDLTLRPSCHECAYKLPNSRADLLLADFWGVEKALPELKGGDGVSLVITHTPRGEQALRALAPEAMCRAVPLEAGTAYNPQILRPAPLPPGRARFFERFGHEDAEALLRELTRQSALQKAASRLKSAVGRALRR